MFPIKSIGVENQVLLHNYIYNVLKEKVIKESQKWWFYAFWEFKGLNLVPTHWTNAILMFDQRRIRWANIKTALVQSFLADPANTKRSSNAGIMLAHRL